MTAAVNLRKLVAQEKQKNVNVVQINVKNIRKKTDAVPLDFVVASTRSVLLKHIKDTTSPQTPSTVDMSYEQYKRVFNAMSRTPYEPTSKVRNSDPGTMFSNTLYRSGVKSSVLNVRISFCITCTYINKYSRNPRATKYIVFSEQPQMQTLQKDYKTYLCLGTIKLPMRHLFILKEYNLLT
ncbi:tubulin glycylase [Acrasis kona]|uniref:Tubulin glycylase n=1 Tax=Acrasis kona TaxID=1008807 RepID=A0AAW2ZME9_9EUKA